MFKLKPVMFRVNYIKKVKCCLIQPPWLYIPASFSWIIKACVSVVCMQFIFIWYKMYNNNNRIRKVNCRKIIKSRTKSTQQCWVFYVVNLNSDVYWIIFSYLWKKKIKFYYRCPTWERRRCKWTCEFINTKKFKEYR